ncbi:alpha/beta hydrolase [Acuticoccus kandeliae]|uniref:alpha/beta hydrolase n=1 Tax=Acuticoccus kandeliae TaxID=2073160 RepID=UPI000D3E5D86|nr:alpha/beta-hydrolase family protein [Acuticoccus kandeliae]
MARWAYLFWNSLSGVGLLLGTLAFAAALTPSLIPRTAVNQGVLAGAGFAIGYCAGVLLRWLWHYMELPEPRRWLRVVVNVVLALACIAVAAYTLREAAGWQNDVRALMGMEPVRDARPFTVCGIAVAVFLVLLALARLFALVFRALSDRLYRVLPRKVANVIGAALAILLFWSVVDGAIVRFGLQAIESSAQELDALIEADIPRPTSPLRSGAEGSLVAWDDLGRAGRLFVGSGPTSEDIAAFTGRKAKEPLRIYAGLRAGNTPEERADVALKELIRVGAFERSNLVVITPTGTGWVDPSAMEPLEYLLDGDVASVAQQYSVLTSPMSLLVEPERGAEAARALFAAVYGHWRTLPRESRPRFYLHGLSLGALNSAKSAELFELIGDPIDGALWSGAPFESAFWRDITDRRNPDSPEWLPRFRDGAFVRFMNQDGGNVPEGTPWGPLRVIFLQYASDPITFFEYRGFFRRPDWMDEPRGPDVSATLRWVPIITMLQVALDMAVSTSAPMGYGHLFAPEHYASGWVELMDIDWDAADLARLNAHMRRAPLFGADSAGG